ncbi:MAG: DMT family transporter [Ruminococcaceae bacterium]|nr:DMT family transporter [Oscillospiraceae bacterium]
MKKISLIYIIVASVLWGTSGIFYNLLEPYGFSPLHMTAMRGIVSAFFFAIYAVVSNRKLFKVTAKELALFFCCGMCVFGAAACYYGAIKFSSVSTAVILMYTAPIFVMTYSVAFLGEKLTSAKAVSIVCMLIGCALVSGVIGGMKFSFLGILLGLGAGLTYGGYNIFAKIAMMKRANSLSTSLYSFIIMGTATALVCNLPKAVVITATNPAIIIPLIIGIGVCTCVLPYFLYTLALKDVPAGTASALGIIEPMAATIFSVAFFGEKLGVASICGIILILGAVMILSRGEKA